MDKIVIKKLCIRASLSSSLKVIHQPILVSIFLPTDATPAATLDDVTLSIDYARLTARIKEKCDDKEFPSLVYFINTVHNTCPIGETEIIAEQPRGHFRSEFIGVKLKNVRCQGQAGYAPQYTFFIKNLHLATIIGINPEERIQKQPVTVDIDYVGVVQNSDVTEVAGFVSELVESSHFLTVESIGLHIATSVQSTFGSMDITVSVTKPKALTFGDGAGVEVTRRGRESCRVSKPYESRDDSGVVCYIAFGSNIEPRIGYVSEALNRIKKADRMKLLDTSFLYESLPMYYEDQGNFFNGVAKLWTDLTPLELLTTLKEIETKVGRVTRFENGPREIDLDILFYGNYTFKNSCLEIPHPRIAQREFVLRPLLDLWDSLIETMMQRDHHAMLESLSKFTISSLQKILPLSRPSCQFNWNSKTFVMGILNLSPDSFSEPGITCDELAVAACQKMENEGVDIIDIGAVSRRPGSTEQLTTEDEIDKLTKLIRLVRQNGVTVPISVDVFKAYVAEAAIDAGANIINDVGMGVRDEKMLQVAESKGVPIILMHTRGTPLDMHLYSTYEKNDVTEAVIKELHEVIEKAISMGIFRWNIILDPGIGFAKSGSQNLQILQNLQKFHELKSPLRGFPVLVGTSRKKWIGTLTKVDDPQKTGPGTMASTAASIFVGADIVRVHDVAENIQVAKFSDAFWRK